MPSFTHQLLHERAAQLPAPKQILLSVGPGYVGTIASWLLLGALIVQIYFYQINYKHDRLWIKAIVYSLLILELVHTGALTHFTFETLVMHWGDTTVLAAPPPTVAVIPLLDGLIGSIVQCFYTYRIYALGRTNLGPILWTKFVCGIVVVLAVAEICCTVASSVLYWGFNSVRSTSPKQPESILLQATLSISFFADFLIASSLIYILYKAKNKSVFHSTSDVISRLIHQSIQTGIWTALVALIELVFLHESRKLRSALIVPSMVLGKIYSNSLLANLNARSREGSVTHSHNELIASNGDEPYLINGMRRQTLLESSDMVIPKGKFGCSDEERQGDSVYDIKPQNVAQNDYDHWRR